MLRTTLGLFIFLLICLCANAQNCAPEFVRAGREKARLGKKAAAIKDYNIAIECDSTYVNAFLDRGNAECDLGEYLLAIKDYSKGISLAPKNPTNYVGRGDALKSLGQWYQAIQDYDKAILLRPTYKLAWLDRGLAKYDGSDIEGAIKDYTQALQLDPKYTYAYLDRGKARGRLGDWVESAQDYDKAILLDADLPAQAYTCRGLAREALNDFPGAFRDIEHAMRLDANDPLCYYVRATTEHKMGRLEASIKDYSKVIALKRDFRRGFFSRGTAYFDLKVYDSAEADFSKAIELNSEEGDAYLMRANIKAILRLEDPCPDFHRAAELGVTIAADAIKRYCR